MLSGGGVGPFAGPALAAVRSRQADEQTAARIVGDVADQPGATLATAVGEVLATRRLGIARETVRQHGGLGRHVHLTSPPCRQCERGDDAPSTAPELSAPPRRSPRTGAASTR